jgi:hypothetical protein
MHKVVIYVERERERVFFGWRVCVCVKVSPSTAFLLSKMLCVNKLYKVLRLFFLKPLPVVNAGATQVIGLQSGMLSGPRDQLLFHWHVNSIFLV